MYRNELFEVVILELDKEKTIQVIQYVQAVVEQMRVDDIEDNPGSAEEEFQCVCCGENKTLAGSMIYANNLYCNDCVLITELSLTLGKIKEPEEMVELMADKRFDNIYHTLFDVEELPDQKENI